MNISIPILLGVAVSIGSLYLREDRFKGEPEDSLPSDTIKLKKKYEKKTLAELPVETPVIPQDNTMVNQKIEERPLESQPIEHAPETPKPVARPEVSPEQIQTGDSLLADKMKAIEEKRKILMEESLANAKAGTEEDMKAMEADRKRNEESLKATAHENAMETK